MGDRLETVEASRGIAALAVVFFHANASMAYMGEQTLGLLSIGESGVDFFFVLSGFIIAHVHGKDVGKPELALNYARKRFTRLFPLLWIVVGGWVALRVLVGEAPASSAVGTSLLLYPSMTEPMPLIVWTLRHEVFFYAMFFLLIMNRKVGEVAFTTWLAACLGQMFLSTEGIPIEGLPAFFLSSYHLDFMVGMFVALAHRRVAYAKSATPFLMGLMAVGLVLFLRHSIGTGRTGTTDYTSEGATLWTALLGCAYAMLLHGILCLEGTKVPKPLLALGASSYALYLIHTPLNSFGQHIAALLPTGASHLFIVSLSVAGGWLLHTRAEKPISALLRQRGRFTAAQR